MDAKSAPDSSCAAERDYQKAYREKYHDRLIAYGRAYYQRNRDKRKTQDGKKYRRNKKHHLARCRDWVLRNREKVLAYQRQYRQKHRKRLAAQQKEYHRKNAKRLNQASREYVNSTPHRRMAAALRKQLNVFIKRKTGRTSTRKLLGCSFEEFCLNIERQFKKNMTWDNYGSYWHLDHIMPCVAFDLSNPQHVMQCFHFTNLRPLEAVKNLSKNRRITEPQLRLPL